MLLGDHARLERRFEMIRSGTFYAQCSIVLVLIISYRTLATDKGFKERVREDMLVRLLDAFVWRSHGLYKRPSSSNLLEFNKFADRQDTDHLGFTYVQGMNVLAAPFLYTMPSEMEAFFCFAKFIEESCPLYVQPTLEGVHSGLKVRSFS